MEAPNITIIALFRCVVHYVVDAIRLLLFENAVRQNQQAQKEGCVTIFGQIFNREIGHYECNSGFLGCLEPVD